MKRLPRIALAVAPFVLLGLAFAQDDIVWNPVAWGENPVVAAVALAGLTTWLRKTAAERGYPIENNLAVAALAIIAGAVCGVLLDVIGVITVAPYATMSAPWAGIAYGVSLAIFNITGIAIWNYLAGKLVPVTVSAPVVVAEDQPGVAIATQGAALSTGNTITDFIVMLARNAVGALRLPVALVALAPLLAEYAQSKAVLNDELRSEIQGRVLSLLRKAGLVGVDL